jgi:hypothetical protein
VKNNNNNNNNNNNITSTTDGVGMPLGLLFAFGPSRLGFGAGRGGVLGAACVWGGVGASMVTSSLLQLNVGSLLINSKLLTIANQTYTAL